jgi:hypothetical protein
MVMNRTSLSLACRPLHGAAHCPCVDLADLLTCGRRRGRAGIAAGEDGIDQRAF